MFVADSSVPLKGVIGVLILCIDYLDDFTR